MSKYPNPCEKCPKDGTSKCNYTSCKPWMTSYLYRQKQINAYAEKVLPAYYAAKEQGTQCNDTEAG